MRAPRLNLVVVVGVLSSSMASIASAGPILGPVTASTNMGTSAGHLPANVINQGGLLWGYASGTTDFETFVTTVTHNPIGQDWLSAAGTLTGHFDFDLGGSYLVESLALWNLGGNHANNLRQFNLYAGSDASFSIVIPLGSFDANPFTGPLRFTPAQVFAFRPTTASFVRMEIVSNNGGPQAVGFGEVAFEVRAAAVPEPGSLLMLTTGLTGLLAAARRSCRRARRTPSAIAN